MWNWPVAYDCMDEWESFPGINPRSVGAEASLVPACDPLVVTAARLYKKWKPYGRPMVLVRNKWRVQWTRHQHAQLAFARAASAAADRASE